MRGDLYGRDARIVEIVTWGRFPFEFAHFTDCQLAALERAAGKPYPSGSKALVTEIANIRARPSPNLEHVWKKGRWPGARLSKTALVDAYWPVLHAKIERAIAARSSGPPIMRAAVGAAAKSDRTWLDLGTAPEPLGGRDNHLDRVLADHSGKGLHAEVGSGEHRDPP